MPRFEVSDNLAETFDFALSWDDWWAEFLANVCCSVPTCEACGGRGADLPTGTSRLLHQDID